MAPIEKGKSLLIIIESTGTLWITAQTPRTTIRLKMLEPITLLNAISFEPLSAAVVLTASSGALVPMATIVSPIITDET